MTDLMMPAFCQAPEQGAIIGRLLAGYGELEFEMGPCLGVTTRGDPEAGVRELFSERGEKDRIRKARKGMVPEYERIGLRKECETALGDMDWCRDVRDRTHIAIGITESRGAWLRKFGGGRKCPWPAYGWAEDAQYGPIRQTRGVLQICATISLVPRRHV